VPKYIIEKNGPLKGEVVMSGSKNAVLPIMAASILTSKQCTITDIPKLRDVDVMCQLLRSVGAEVNIDYIKKEISITCDTVSELEAPYELVKQMRASNLIMGPLLSRTGKVKISMPGGCAIGARPIDLHLKGFQALGAEIELEHGYVEARAEKLIGDKIYLDFPSVGATENIMMCAVLAQGITTIENAAEEPEIVDLANFLNSIGAKIKGAGTDTIKIEGVSKSELTGTKHAIIPDRIETGTFMVAAAVTRGNLLIKNAIADHVKPIIAKLKECGVEITETDGDIRVTANKGVKATDIKTLPYPGFPTDMQAQFMTLLTSAIGTSIIIETVFENRYMHIGELNRMGSNIKIEGRSAVVPGEQMLEGAQVTATDLRAGAALVLAGLIAEGTTEISDIYHIERGYSEFVEKLSRIGAKIRKVED